MRARRGSSSPGTPRLRCLTGGPGAGRRGARGWRARRGARDSRRLAAIFPGAASRRGRAAPAARGGTSQPGPGGAGPRGCACRSSRTNGVRYARVKDKELHDVLTCIRHHTTARPRGELLAAQRERHLKDAAGDVGALRRPRRQALDAALGAVADSSTSRSRISATAFPTIRSRPARRSTPYLRQRGVERRADALPAADRAGAGADRQRAGDDREAPARRLLPDRLGHRAVLPAARRSSCRGAARPPTAPSATRSRSPRWTR